tara:strand:- start:149 stop:286 length:138 start_codon:yes stop_codon:yes gene_type:complete
LAEHFLISLGIEKVFVRQVVGTERLLAGPFDAKVSLVRDGFSIGQ